VIDISTTAGDNRLPVLAGEIRKAHAAAVEHQRRGLVEAMRAGDLLIEAKALAGHGNWLPWLQEHCQLSERTAQLYMRLAKNRSVIEAKSATVADLGIRGAIEALTRPAMSEIDRARAMRGEIAELDDELQGLGHIADASTDVDELIRCSARAKEISDRLARIGRVAQEGLERLSKEMEESGFDPLRISDPLLFARFEQEAAAWEASAPDLPSKPDAFTPEHTQSAREHAAAFLAICDRLGFRRAPVDAEA
jgi:DUF3102 family protein